jgi:ribosomal protein L19
MSSARPLEIGDVVEHRVFGEGLVIRMEGEGASESVVVRFNSDGKQLKKKEA